MPCTFSVFICGAVPLRKTSIRLDSLLSDIADVPRLMREMETVVRCDGTVSMAKREELLSGSDAEVIAKVLQFSMIRPEGNAKGP